MSEAEAIRYTWLPEWRDDGFYVTEVQEPRHLHTALTFGPIPDKATCDAFIASRKRIVSESVLSSLARSRAHLYDASRWRVPR